MQQWIDSDLEALVEKLPPNIANRLKTQEYDQSELLEVVLDLGREPEARYLEKSVTLGAQEVTFKDINHVLERIGHFGGDNRAGIERTLHRISAIRNRTDTVVGLTLRVGRSVHGTIKIIEDLIFSGESILLLGRPGVGKTTMLREVARVLADDAHKRVVVVDTSNEIAGDGDIPHQGIGRARRMQVPSPVQQHAVMIEAVENHMPEVIIIDEIGTELEATAARTIAERGVQLVATAHGNTLNNLIQNPTLSDLVGGVHTVTLGDIEARRRRTQKTVLERRSPPTFESLVEIQGWNQVAIHSDIAAVVDQLLRGFTVTSEMRSIDRDGMVTQTQSRNSESQTDLDGSAVVGFKYQPTVDMETAPSNTVPPLSPRKMTHILPYGVNRGKLQQAIRGSQAAIELVANIDNAELLLTTKNFYRRRTQALRQAEEKGKPVYVLRKNTITQIQQFFRAIERSQRQKETSGDAEQAIKEAEEAVDKINGGDHEVGLNPQGAYVRHLQHQVAEERGLESSSTGREPSRHVVFYQR